MTDRFVDPAVAGERFDRLRIVIERSALAKHEARIGRVEEVLVDGPSKNDPRCSRPDTAEQARPLRRSSSRSAPAATPTVEITGAAPHHLRGRFVDVSPSRPTGCASPSPPVTSTRPSSRCWADGVGQVGRGDGRRHGRRPAPRSSPSTRCRCTGGWTSAPPSRRPPTRRASATTASTSSSRRDVHGGRATSAAYDRAVASGRRAAPLLVAGTGLYLTAVIDDLDLPGEWPEIRAELAARRRRRRAPRPARRARPGRRRPHRARQPAPHRARARGLRRQRPAVQLVRARPRRLPADRRRADRAALATRRRSPRASSSGWRR